MKGLGILSDFDLVEVYEKAVSMKLDQDFTKILLVELDRRGIRNQDMSICLI